MKVLKAHPKLKGCICFGIMANSEWKRQGKGFGNNLLWDSKAGPNYCYLAQNDKAGLRIGGNEVEINKPCIYEGDTIKIELNCDENIIQFWIIKKGEKKENIIGKLNIKERNTKWYPAMMAYASFDGDFRLFFD